MVTTLPEKKALMAQRRIRRLRQQRQTPAHVSNGNGAVDKPKRLLTIYDLGWTKEQALANHYRYKIFEEDWHAPGMEIYDED